MDLTESENPRAPYPPSVRNTANIIKEEEDPIKKPHLHKYG